ncbi:MAG: ABC transporter substrate-binding protein [Actinomycetota bacterium]|nr:ABC transporter substrate-binding protein [Actinomycetota bacterium]
MKGRRSRVLALVIGASLVLLAAAGTAGSAGKQRGEVWLAEISPLTGPLSFVGVDNRAGVNVAVAEINRRGGINGRRVRVQVFDDGSNPSQAVSHMNRIADDDKFVGVIGSGFSSSGLAVAPIVERERIPYISMASSAAQVTPAKPYYYMTTATSRLFAYSLAFQLRRQGIRRIALMADNGGFGREGVRNVEELARRFGFQIVEQIIFPLTSTTFQAELNRVRNSRAQALWVWNATTLAVTITKEARQLRLPQRLVLTGGNASPQYLQPACPQNNGALINSYLGPVARYLPRRNPSRAIALRVDRGLRKQGSTFNYDGYTGVMMFRTAMLRGGFSRTGINNALENRMRGFVGPGGRYYYSRENHSGHGLRSMIVSRIARCRMVPVENLRRRF